MEQQLWVEVSFPCAPNAICQAIAEYEDADEKDHEEEIPPCCPVTDFLPMNTTVTLYNKHDQNDIQMSLQSEDQEGSVVDEPRQADFEEEETIVHLSILSLNDMLPSNPSSFYPHFHSLGDRYYTTATLHDRFCDGNDDTNYYFRDVETNGLDCASPTPTIHGHAGHHFLLSKQGWYAFWVIYFHLMSQGFL
ncbi:hypothetical protein QTP86_004246 [Hemibagrus guttatus]|nr:hypothetical protein QTP86_004246 [Hemibagrus guttatus]